MASPLKGRVRPNARALGESRFWAKVDKISHPGGCWLYMGFRKWDGYGWLSRSMSDSVKPRYMTAHRYSWILRHGEDPKLQILHRCDNPPCCNPDHLFLGTHAENHKDKVAKRRHRNGRGPSQKINTWMVRPRRAA